MLRGVRVNTRSIGAAAMMTGAMLTTAATNAHAAESTPARPPLMGLLEDAGVAKPLDDARVNVYGHVEGSFTYNAEGHPEQNLNLGRVFDIENEDPTLNQLTLNFERLVTPNKSDFDLGGRVEVMWGGDARFIHANGLGDNDDFFSGPENQFDLTQAYVDVAVPVGDGLRIRAGKFAFFKQIDPNNSVFYSHSFTFGGALPFTLTGVYGTYKLGDQWVLDGGISRGWDQSLKDNNDWIDFFGRARYNWTKQTAFTAAFITGPEQDGDNGNWRTAIDLTASHQANEDLLLLADVIFGQQANPNGLGGDAYWYGISGYAQQKINKMFSVAGRLEWFRDDGGYTTGVDQSLWEGTLGVTITPFPDDRYGQFFKIRPEIRYDYSDEKFFDGLTKYGQFTAAVDAIFNF